MTRSLLVSLALVVALLSLPAACGGGSEPELSTPSGTVPSTFSALAEKAQKATYRFDYKIVGPTGDLQETGTFYRKPPKLRIDRLVGTEAMPVSATTIWRDDEMVDCSRPEGGEWRCEVSPADGQADGLPAVITSPQGFDIREEEGRTLVGQVTACFVAVPTGETVPPFPEEFEVCLNQDGALLFQRTRVGGSGGEDGTPGPYIEVTREATSYSAQVGDSDFDPPAEPLTRP